MNVLLLQGGAASQRDATQGSAEMFSSGAQALGHAVQQYYADEGSDRLVGLLANAQVVFPALPAGSSEDVMTRHMLEAYRAAFIGATSDNAQQCADRLPVKKILNDNDLPTPAWEEVSSKDFSASRITAGPYILQPRTEAPESDTFVVERPEDAVLDMSVFERHPTMMLEEYAGGTQLAVAMLGAESLPVVEIQYPEGVTGSSQAICPVDTISQALQDEAQNLAEQAHFFLGARHYSLVHMRLTEHGKLFVLGINTSPDLRPEAPFIKATDCAGLSHSELVNRLLEAAQHGE